LVAFLYHQKFFVAKFVPPKILVLFGSTKTTKNFYCATKKHQKFFVIRKLSIDATENYKKFFEHLKICKFEAF